MKYIEHSNLKDKHAFLSASKYAWLRYDVEKLRSTYLKREAALLGTRMHSFASESILLNIKLPRNNNTINKFVNDAIGFKMESEIVLYYSANCFGTADALSFRKNKLRIHDLKTGTSKTSFDQLLIYAALFCLEYGVNPDDIDIELRIYQSNEIKGYIPEVDEVRHVMDTIIEFDNEINKICSEV